MNRLSIPTCGSGFDSSNFVGNFFADGEKFKLDIMYKDPFLKVEDILDGIRFASVEDIVP